MADESGKQQPRFWFPYWTNPNPNPAHVPSSAAPAQPGARRQLSKKDSQAAPPSSRSPQTEPPARTSSRSTPATSRSLPPTLGDTKPQVSSKTQQPKPIQSNADAQPKEISEPEKVVLTDPLIGIKPTETVIPEITPFEAETKPKPYKTIDLEQSPQGSPLHEKEKHELTKEVIQKEEYLLDEKQKEIVEEKGMLETNQDLKELLPYEESKKMVEKKLPISNSNTKRTQNNPDATEHRGKAKKKHSETHGASSSTHQAENVKLQKEIKNSINDLIQKLHTLHPHQLGNEHGMNIITLAGENKGAAMHIGHEHLKEDNLVQNGHKLNEKKVTATSPAITSTINSNVQSINNSILFHSSCSEGDPGVHLKLSNKSKMKEKQHGGSDGSTEKASS